MSVSDVKTKIVGYGVYADAIGKEASDHDREQETGDAAIVFEITICHADVDGQGEELLCVQVDPAPEFLWFGEFVEGEGDEEQGEKFKE